jgi:hypothetical protein
MVEWFSGFASCSGRFSFESRQSCLRALALYHRLWSWTPRQKLELHHGGFFSTCLTIHNHPLVHFSLSYWQRPQIYKWTHTKWKERVRNFVTNALCPPLCDASSIPRANVKLFLCHEGVWGSGGIAPPFLTSALDGGEWSASRLGTHCIGGWVGPRAGLDAVKKRKILYSPESNPGRPSSHYTDWAIPALQVFLQVLLKCRLSYFWICQPIR